jgi:hypothetical protein
MSVVRLLGRCHCGNVSLSLEWTPTPAEIPARACTCSFCTRHGNVWTSGPSARLEVEVEDAALVSRYAFGTRTAEFHVCARCGVVPVATSEIDGVVYAVVNVSALEGLEPTRLRRLAADVEGESADARLARRKRNWIADVRITERRGGAQGKRPTLT